MLEPRKKLSFDQMGEVLEKRNYSDDDIRAMMLKLEEICRLRDLKNAVILAHYYQTLPIQLVADALGDSLKLAQATEVIGDRNLVVFSGVKFMAETTKLLNPDREVVVPDMRAGCSIADGINGEMVRRIRDNFPDAAIVSYINVYADTKAAVDVVCTSANATDVLRNISGNPIITLPDESFFVNVINGMAERGEVDKTYITYCGKEGGSLIFKDVLSGELHTVGGGDLSLPVLDRGVCVVHDQFTPEQVAYLRRKERIDHVMVHPEVRPEVAAVADMVGGTGAMVDFVGRNRPQTARYLVLTECDLTAPLINAYPEAEFVTPCIICPHMKRNSLDGLINSLRDEVYRIELDPSTFEGARESLERMFELTG